MGWGVVDVGEFGFLLEEETNPGSTRAMLLTEASHLVSAASSLKLCTWARPWICPRPLTHTTYPPPPPRPLRHPHPCSPSLWESSSERENVEPAWTAGGLAARQKADAQQLSQRCSKNPADKPAEARARLHRRDAKPRVVFLRRGHAAASAGAATGFGFSCCCCFFFVAAAAALLPGDAAFKDQSHFSWRIFKGSLWSLLLDKHVVFTLSSFSPDVLSLGSNFSTELNKTQTLFFFPPL